MPLLQGTKVRNEANWPEEDFVQISESQVGRAVRTCKWKYGIIAPDIDGFTVPASDSYDEAYLYDLLNSDPYELTPLIGYDSHRETYNDAKSSFYNEISSTPHIVYKRNASDNSLASLKLFTIQNGYFV